MSALFDDVLAGFDDEEALFDADGASLFFLPPSEGPLIPPKSQWKDTKIPSTAMLRMIDFRRGKKVEIAGQTYLGGRWYQVTQAQAEAIAAAGYGDRLVALDDIGDRPAGLG
jgi:hypothetical protein